MSLGIAVQGVVVVGFQAGAGVVMDLENFGTTGGFYGFGGFVEGLEGGVEVGFVVGCWHGWAHVEDFIRLVRSS